MKYKLFSRFLEDNGFKRRGNKNIWAKNIKCGIIFIRLRKSSFSSRIIIEFGIYFEITKGIDLSTISFKDCQFESSIERIVLKSLDWETGIIEVFNEKEQIIFKEQILTELNRISNIDYLKGHFPNDFDHDRWWLANIRELDFIDWLSYQ